MTCIIKETMISGMNAIILENERIRVSVLPEAGAKIYNFVFKDTGRDFAWHSPITPLKKPVYGSSFISHDCGGFDELLPTVDACKWKGKHLPDHGEVWQLPWKVVDLRSGPEQVSLKTRCTCKASPFIIERDVILKRGEPEALLKYKITNTGKEEWEYIWALHASVSLGKRTRILLPAGTRVNVWWSESDRMGKRGKWLDWPIARDEGGNEVDLGVMGEEITGHAEKLFTGGLREGWIAALDMDTKEEIRFSFPLDKIPMAGLWLNRGGWRGYGQLGLEPTNTAGDALDAAVEDYLRKYASLRAGESTEFDVRISITSPD
jgi:galactose mutarotase-like enzyme